MKKNNGGGGNGANGPTSYPWANSNQFLIQHLSSAAVAAAANAARSQQHQQHSQNSQSHGQSSQYQSNHHNQNSNQPLGVISQHQPPPYVSYQNPVYASNSAANALIENAFKNGSNSSIDFTSGTNANVPTSVTSVTASTSSLPTSSSNKLYSSCSWRTPFVLDPSMGSSASLSTNQNNNSNSNNNNTNNTTSNQMSNITVNDLYNFIGSPKPAIKSEKFVAKTSGHKESSLGLVDPWHDSSQAMNDQNQNSNNSNAAAAVAAAAAAATALLYPIDLGNLILLLI